MEWETGRPLLNSPFSKVLSSVFSGLHFCGLLLCCRKAWLRICFAQAVVLSSCLVLLCFALFMLGFALFVLGSSGGTPCRLFSWLISARSVVASLHCTASPLARPLGLCPSAHCPFVPRSAPVSHRARLSFFHVAPIAYCGSTGEEAPGKLHFCRLPLRREKPLYRAGNGAHSFLLRLASVEAFRDSLPECVTGCGGL